MKSIITILALVAFINLSAIPFSVGGETKRQPLQLEEMVELKEKEASDFEVVKNVDAGASRGNGLVKLGLAIAAGYWIAEELDDDDDDD